MKIRKKKNIQHKKDPTQIFSTSRDLSPAECNYNNAY